MHRIIIRADSINTLMFQNGNLHQNPEQHLIDCLRLVQSMDLPAAGPAEAIGIVRLFTGSW